MLTSPLEGLRVPTTATSSNGQNAVEAAKASPVPIIRIVAPSSRVR
jgi:hypothetical protein